MLEELYQYFEKSNGVCIDSRILKQNQLFFAFSGEFYNGADFAVNAIEEGALLAIVEDKRYMGYKSIMVVDSVLKTLQKLAEMHRKKFDVPIFALTGSNGKTTTKELLYQVIEKKYKSHCTQGNFNNHIGVPLTILQMPRDTEFAIIEMGANHQYEIKGLCQIAHPTHGYITNIGKAHLEGFGSIEGVLKSKLELFDYLDNNGGHSFINLRDTMLSQEASKYSNSIALESDYRFMDWRFVEYSSDPFLNIKVESKDSNLRCKTSLIGDYNIENVFAALAIGYFFGVNLKDGINAVASYVSQNNRSSLMEVKGHHFIMDAYNANPTSMKKAIVNFDNMNVQNKVLILGDMLELGEDSPQEHQIIIDIVNNANWNHVIFVGNIFAACNHYDFHACNNIESAVEKFKRLGLNNSWVLLKGSRGIHLESLVKQI